MKILFCDNSLKSFLNFRGKVAEYFHCRGFDTLVVVPCSETEKEQLIKVPSFLRVLTVNMKPSGRNPLADLAYLAALLKIYSRERPDIVCHYTVKPNTYGGIASRMLRIPSVAMVAGLGYTFNGNSLIKRLARKLYLFGLRQAKVVLTLNEGNTRQLEHNGITCCHQLQGGEGVDLSLFPFTENSTETVTFLFVGRVLYDKGYREFIDAARLVVTDYPDVHFEILGPTSPDSPMRVPEHVFKEDMAKGPVKYLGATDNVLPYISRQGVVLVCSSYHEGMNRSLMEGCAVGRPCITSNIPGCREMVDDGVSGFVVEPKSSHLLASAMRAYLELSGNDRHAMGLASHRKAVAEFNVEHVCEEYGKVINQVLNLSK